MASDDTYRAPASAAAPHSASSDGARTPQPSAAVDIPTPSARLQAFWPTPKGRAALSLIIDYFHATLEAQEHIPATGPALIVSNHALFALDTAVLGALIVRDVKRHPRFLADRKLWTVPGLRQVISAIGGLPGEPLAANVLLRRGELVVVYPGGVDDSLKSNAERYHLKWKTRAGFARVAMAAGAPIIPVVGLGIDEMYWVLGREHWLGRRVFGAERYDLPIPLGAYGTILPRRVRQRYIVLPAIDTTGDPKSPADVERVRAATHEAIDSQLRALRRI
jgi:1-acyl-sn-glycerol-3-phosphate acyltransferase